MTRYSASLLDFAITTCFLAFKISTKVGKLNLILSGLFLRDIKKDQERGQMRNKEEEFLGANGI